MKIESINNSSGLTQVNGAATQGATKVKGTHTFPSPETLTDHTEVNSASQVDARIIQGAKLILEATSDIRPDKVALARQRLQTGFYNQPKVRESIAAKMAADPEAHPAPPLSLERIADIKKRIAEGFYEQSEVKEHIVNRLLDEAEGV